MSDYWEGFPHPQTPLHCLELPEWRTKPVGGQKRTGDEEVKQHSVNIVF